MPTGFILDISTYRGRRYWLVLEIDDRVFSKTIWPTQRHAQRFITRRQNPLAKNWYKQHTERIIDRGPTR